MKTKLDFAKKKKANEKITMLTCYDYTTAKILNATSIDSLLVGDSVAQVMYGHPNTLNATTEMIARHTKAVVDGAPDKFVVADMPFLSFRKGLKHSMDNVHLLLRAGAHAVKIEGVLGHESVIHHIAESGIPVMGHLGLTPQSIHQLGGPKIQGRDQKVADQMLADAIKLQELGCFSLVLECVPADLAAEITNKLTIPTIGIGAGQNTSGQILVKQDMLGMNSQFSPKFLKKYAALEDQIKAAVENYISEVGEAKFPAKEHSYE
jgi:3-methyl-2-oxobutanoate hydroxymethyltransferase